MNLETSVSCSILLARESNVEREGGGDREKSPFAAFSPLPSPLKQEFWWGTKRSKCHFIFNFLKQLLKTSFPPYLCTNTEASPVSFFLQKFWLIPLLFKQNGFTLPVKKSGVCRFRKSCMFELVFDFSFILASDNATRPAFLRKGHQIKLHLIRKIPELLR